MGFTNTFDLDVGWARHVTAPLARLPSMVRPQRAHSVRSASGYYIIINGLCGALYWPAPGAGRHLRL